MDSKSEINYYRILQVRKMASLEEIKQAYRKLAIKWHPDKHKTPAKNAQAHIKFPLILEAYRVLSDIKSRHIYDQFGIEGLKAQSAKSNNDEDPKSKNIFRPVNETTNNKPGSKGETHIKLLCTLEELYTGTMRIVKLSPNEVNVLGQLVPVEKTFKIDIKPGWKHGDKLMYNKDFGFVIEMKPHNVYKRQGDDLILVQKIPLHEALTGTTLTITTLDGRTLIIPCNEILSPQYEKIIPNEGMPISKKDPGNRGNMKIKFDIMFPRCLTLEQKTILKTVLAGPIIKESNNNQPNVQVPLHNNQENTRVLQEHEKTILDIYSTHMHVEEHRKDEATTITVVVQENKNEEHIAHNNDVCNTMTPKHCSREHTNGDLVNDVTQQQKDTMFDMDNDLLDQQGKEDVGAVFDKNVEVESKDEMSTMLGEHHGAMEQYRDDANVLYMHVDEQPIVHNDYVCTIIEEQQKDYSIKDQCKDNANTICCGIMEEEQGKEEPCTLDSQTCVSNVSLANEKTPIKKNNDVMLNVEVHNGTTITSLHVNTMLEEQQHIYSMDFEELSSNMVIHDTFPNDKLKVCYTSRRKRTKH